MSTGVERARALERDGIQTDRVRWNLSAAALYEEAVRRSEGRDRRRGPAGVPDRPAHRPLARTTSSSSASRRARRTSPGARSTGRWSRRQFDAAASRSAGSLAGKELFVLDCYAGADPAYRLPVRIINEFAWHNLFCRNLFIDDPRQRMPAPPAVHDHRFAELQGRSGAPRHEFRRRHRAQLRQAAGAHRRHAATPAR